MRLHLINYVDTLCRNTYLTKLPVDRSTVSDKFLERVLEGAQRRAGAQQLQQTVHGLERPALRRQHREELASARALHIARATGCFSTLLGDYRSIDSFEQCPPQLNHALRVFRERIDFEIENSIPQSVRYSEKIQKSIGIHGDLLSLEADRSTATFILNTIREEDVQGAAATPLPARGGCRCRACAGVRRPAFAADGLCGLGLLL
jgi:hypothetical protein